MSFNFITAVTVGAQENKVASLITTWPNLRFGTQGKPRSPTNKKRGTERRLCPGSPPGSCLVSVPLLFEDRLPKMCLVLLSSRTRLICDIFCVLSQPYLTLPSCSKFILPSERLGMAPCDERPISLEGDSERWCGPRKNPKNTACVSVSPTRLWAQGQGFFCSLPCLKLLFSSGPCAWVTVRPDKSKCPSLEQRRVYRGAKKREQDGLCSKDWNSQIISREEFWQKQHLEWGQQGGWLFFWWVGGEATGWFSKHLLLSLKLPSSPGWGPSFP